MLKFEYLNDARLRKPKTPSHWEKEPEYTPVTRLDLDCGGKMWSEYVYRVDTIPSNEIVKFKRYDGKDIMLNTSYIVLAQNFKIAKAELNISEWASATGWYTEDNIESYYVLIDDDAELQLLDETKEEYSRYER